MLLDPATGAISWAPNSDQYGEHLVTIEAADGRGGAATQSYVIAAGLPRDNHAPLILTEPQSTVPGTLPYVYPIRAEDPDGDPLHTQLVTAPDGMSFDPYTQQIEWDVRGTALVFEGLHRVDIPDDDSLHSQNLTLESWVRFDEETTSRRELFLKTVGSWESFDLYYENNALFVRAGNSGTATAMAIPFTPEVGRWYHLAVTFDDDNDVYAIYVDGNQAQSAATGLSLGYDASWIRIGGRDSDAFLRGAMDEIRVWSVARSEAQIREEMRRALRGDEDGLVAYYPADEGRGTILHDQSGHGNDGLMGEPNSFPPRWETSFGLGRTEPVTVRVRDVWGAVAEQVFEVTVSAEVPANVRGIVFDDENGDGVYQPETESALIGRQIFVDRNQNGVYEPDERGAITDVVGNYSISDLVPGDYPVTLLGQAGWRPTAPAEGVLDISASAGQTTVVDFGSTQQNVIAGNRSPSFCQLRTGRGRGR